jgi:hypothetical protein
VLHSACGVGKLQLYNLLTSALDEVSGQFHVPTVLNLGKYTPICLKYELIWPSTGLDTLQTRKVPRTCRRCKHNPQCSRCTTSAIFVRLRSVSFIKFRFIFICNHTLYSYDTGTHEVYGSLHLAAFFIYYYSSFLLRSSLWIYSFALIHASSHVVEC